MSAGTITRDDIGKSSGIPSAKQNDINVNITEDFHLCAQLADCKDIYQFKQRISSIIKQLQFSDFSLTSIDGSAIRVLSTMPQELSQQYLNDGYAESDFFMEHAKTSTVPIFLSDLKDYIACAPFSSERLELNKKIFELFAHHGYSDCYSVPRDMQNKSIRLMFSIADKDSSRDEFRRKVERCKPVLSLLIDAVIYFGISKFPEAILCTPVEEDVAITPKPLRLLTVMAREGLMLKDAAIKLCISVDTANKHIAAAKQALGATTLANAVYLAMLHGLIKNDDG